MPSPFATLYAGFHSTAERFRRVLFEARSEFQEILLIEDPSGALLLFLDRFCQFHSGDEQRYHEALVDLPIVCAPDPRQVLVLGDRVDLLLGQFGERQAVLEGQH